MAMGIQFDGILAAARVRAEWAWGKIYSDLAASILGYMRACGAREPEDLTGEVFLQMVRDLGNFQGDEQAFRSWVFTIAHRRVLDERRSLSRTLHTVPITEDAAQVAAPGNAESKALERLATAGVQALIGGLSEDQRNVLMLRIIADLSLAQIATVLGKPLTAVKRLQQRGLAGLAKSLGRKQVSFIFREAVSN